MIIDLEKAIAGENMIFSQIYSEGWTYSGEAEYVIFSFWLPGIIPSDWARGLATRLVMVWQDEDLTPLRLFIWLYNVPLGKRVIVDYHYHGSPLVPFALLLPLIMRALGVLALVVLGLIINAVGKFFYGPRQQASQTAEELSETGEDLILQAASCYGKGEDPAKCLALREMGETLLNDAVDIRKNLPKPTIPSLGWKETALIAGGLGVAGLFIATQGGRQPLIVRA